MTAPEDSPRPEDSPSSTRPISVAELLAKNGTIGAPPVGGRRRRRRGNSDAVTVAELTGEIPIVADEAPEAPEETPGEASDEAPDEAADVAETEAEADADAQSESEPDSEPESETDDDHAEADADYTAHLQARDDDSAPVEFETRPRRPHYAHALRRHPTTTDADTTDSDTSGAEQMSPDPVMDDDDFDSPVDLVEPPETDYADDSATDLEDGKPYPRSTEGELFGGPSGSDDLAPRGAKPGPEDIDLEDREDEADQADRAAAAPASTMSTVVHGAWIVGQCVIAVAFGAGLFVAFDQLWKWNNIVALILSVLVILGLVVGVRVVRKTEDIGSTLIAVAVGALVTLGPLALLQSG